MAGRVLAGRHADRRRRGERGDHAQIHKGGAVQAVARDGYPGDQRGNAERKVVDGEDPGDEGGALTGIGQRTERAKGAEECHPEADARHGGAGEEGGSRHRGDGAEGHRGAGEQDQASGQHRRGRGETAAQDGGRRPDPGEQEDRQAAPQPVRRAKHLRGQRRPERQVKASQSPGRLQARHGHREGPARPGRHLHPRP